MIENENAGPASSANGGVRLVPSVSNGVFDHLSRGALRPHLVRSMVFLAIVIIFATIWMIGLTFSALSALSQVGVHAPDLGPETDSFLSLLGLGGIVVFGLGWLVSLFVTAREFVDEGGVLVPNASVQLSDVYNALRAVVDIGCPDLSVQVREGEVGRTVRVSQGQVWAVIVLREAGPHLYLGWAMWRARSTARLFGRVFADLVAGAGPDDARLIEASSSGVLRELLRIATEQSLPRPR
jgi:hypothetical protein